MVNIINYIIFEPSTAPKRKKEPSLKKKVNGQIWPGLKSAKGPISNTLTGDC